ncbi:putative disease resistance protein RGA3 [Oryza sativa Japonica Group]|jgi:prefoldin subunit 5|uniref:Os12g0204700 protein n=4 Tax=Oryza TaxID=4527 RepID=A3AI99_ORYSJ|nr:putative disease resistance protein RGA3 [Oryza sativa Japonica Group]ABA96116.1 NB-ARC domain containing protein, expressed [Oryza sativa Japonica Group]EAZ27038.1 hypothetical protein OsJ_10968 [Oryza sativa Japonica Group]BAH95563.1 Os12g0204700 [Oryza sativa Japonica Group]|eukprot:NP_001176835.1 Os12g0204700 [Oryza sativa Japonica Group]
METAVLVFAGKSLATPAISFFVNKAFSYLNEYRKAEGLEAVKNRLEENIPKIQSVIDVADPDYIKDKSEALDAWLWQLRDAVEEAEDAIDELEVERDQNKVSHQAGSSSFTRMKHKFVQSVKHVRVLGTTSNSPLKRLKKALEGLDEAAKGVKNFLTLVQIHQNTRSNLNNPEQDDISFRAKGKDLNADRVFGRENEKEHIVGWLTNTSSEDNQDAKNNNHVPIMSIVGHGGIGKTTLAQLISHDSRIKKHFDTVIWVAVSMSFDAKTLLDKIIQSVTLLKPSVDTYEALQQHLKKEIETIKYLLILDDVWEDKDISKWENLFSSLRTGVCGRKILLTTRMQSVADLASAVMRCEREFFPLCGLEEDENLRLFNHHAFINPDPQEFEDFQQVGEEIAKKLRGCPLVTKVVAGHLRAHMKVQFWNTFLHEHLDNFDGSMEDVVKVLKLSYYHLVPGLQVCFRYCSIFPKNHEFKKEELVKMWIAAGLISQTTGEAERAQDAAEEYLDLLNRKSFFELKLRNFRFGRNECHEYFVMHDLMHDLATWVSSGECARIADVASSKKLKPTVRHLSVAGIDGFPVDAIKSLSQFKNLRTIIIEDCHDIQDDTSREVEKVIESLKALRVVQYHMFSRSRFPGKEANLKHLRYVSVSMN